MSAIKKFMFENNFDEPSDAENDVVTLEEEVEAFYEEPPAPTYSEAELAAARDGAFAQGAKEAEQNMRDSLEQKSTSVLGNIAGQINALVAGQTASREETTRLSIQIAAGIMRKMFPTLNEAAAHDETLRIVKEALEKTIGETSLVIHVHASLVDTVNAHLATLEEAPELQEKVSVRADHTMTEGDCRVEWKSGGVDRNAEALWSEIDTILARNINLDDAMYPPPEGDDEGPAERMAKILNTPEMDHAMAIADAMVAKPDTGAAVSTDAAPTPDVETAETAPEITPDGNDQPAENNEEIELTENASDAPTAPTDEP